MDLPEEIKSFADLEIAQDKIMQAYLKRLERGNYSRDEDKLSHYCAYFLPYNPETKQIFIIHHKKSGKWLSPGGHVDKGETLLQALKREVYEELGIKNKINDDIKPFLLTITPIAKWEHRCEEHFDVWHRFPTDGSEFKVDPTEFLAMRWLTIPEARKIVIDPANIEMLDSMEKFFAQG